MRIPYCINIPPIYDLEAEVECDLDRRFGEPIVDIGRVVMGDVDLLISDDPLHRMLGDRIANAAQDDERVLERLIEAEMEAA